MTHILTGSLVISGTFLLLLLIYAFLYGRISDIGVVYRFYFRDPFSRMISLPALIIFGIALVLYIGQ